MAFVSDERKLNVSAFSEILFTSFRVMSGGNSLKFSGYFLLDFFFLVFDELHKIKIVF